ncbi:hypothetical protein L484_000036 [Morus notabilis]|uniref:Uncharacterized protein n=1 Tax=Morus notabilis TaxID=981085 RepID=W9S5R3_9ROSA|nr:hypothetical protein L484_001073 [Morus notabilis]EXC62793.1 hypothetical protein L484_000036 [Morus notabilis]
MDDPIDKCVARRECDPLDRMNYPALFSSDHNTDPAYSDGIANQALTVVQTNLPLMVLRSSSLSPRRSPYCTVAYINWEHL